MADPLSTSPARGGRAAPSKKTEDPELVSVRHLTVLWDKTFKAGRTYGITNQVTQKFVNQFYQELTEHIDTSGNLTFVVQGFRLFYKHEVVYESPTPTENLAFKLFADGIRELSFNEGLSKDDLTYFLETLGEEYGSVTSDEDIVSRLWAKNLSTISLVTAEEIVKSLNATAVITPQDSDTMNSPVSHLAQIQVAETARRAQEKATGTTAKATDEDKERVGSELAQFEVSPQELDELAHEIEAESSRDDSVYLLDMLTAILVSESSLLLHSKILDVFGQVLEMLILRGDWNRLDKVLGLLHEIEHRPDLSEADRRKLADLFETLAQPANIRAIASVLNQSPSVSTERLLPLLLQLKPAAVPSLCTLLTKLEHQEHRLVICEALAVLAKETPEHLVKGLSHRTGLFVRDFIYVMTRLGNPRLAPSLEQVSQHQESRVRKEAILAFGILCPTGNGRPLVAFLDDPVSSIRLSAFKLLTSGDYAVPFDVWAPIVLGKAFLDRPVSEKRTIFLAIRHTAGTEAVPYWRQLLLQRLWLNRTLKQELGALAAEALGEVGTPDAISALEAGRKRRNRVIRNACAAALAGLV